MPMCSAVSGGGYQSNQRWDARHRTVHLMESPHYKHRGNPQILYCRLLHELHRRRIGHWLCASPGVWANRTEQHWQVVFGSRERTASMQTL